MEGWRACSGASSSASARTACMRNRPFGNRVPGRVPRATRVTLCAVVIGIFYLSTVRSGQPWADDFSLYIAHARNIANGASYADTGYIYNPHNPAVGPRVYPPG